MKKKKKPVSRRNEGRQKKCKHIIKTFDHSKAFRNEVIFREKEYVEEGNVAAFFSLLFRMLKISLRCCLLPVGSPHFMIHQTRYRCYDRVYYTT